MFHFDLPEDAVLNSLNILLKLGRHLVFYWVIGLAVSFAPAQAKEAVTTLVFATYPSERPSEEQVKLEPIRQAIEDGLNDSGRKYSIIMRIFTTYDEAIEAMASGGADFARLGPVSYIRAKRRNSGLSLLAKESQGESGFLKGFIFVHQDSPIRNLEDLRGHRVAFGEPGSTTGAYLPQAALLQAGLRAKDLAAHQFLGRHDKVVFAVGAGAFDAGATNEVTFRKYGPGKNLREIHVLQSPAHAWVARKGLSSREVALLQSVLLNLKSEDLVRISRDRFLPAKDADYDDLRKAMKQTERFFE